MNIQAGTSMRNGCIKLSISGIVYRSHLSYENESKLLFIYQIILCKHRKPCHIYLAKEVMQQEPCCKLVSLMVRLKGWWHQASLLHQSAHSSHTSTFGLGKVGVMENLTDTRVTEFRTWLSPKFRRLERIAWVVNLNTIGISYNLYRLIHSVGSMNESIDYRLTQNLVRQNGWRRSLK